MNNYLIHYNLRAKIKYKQGYVTKGSYRLLGKVKKNNNKNYKYNYLHNTMKKVNG